MEMLIEILEVKVTKRHGRRNLRCSKRRVSKFKAKPKGGTAKLPKRVGLIMLK